VTPMRLLENGIPLSLLLDLAFGPESADLLDHERPSGPDGGLVGSTKARRQRPTPAVRPV
jgi:hypothetical protein